MSASSITRSAAVDDLDLRILHCLVVDGRAPFARIGGVLGVSEQTVARRFRRLRDEGLVHVVVGATSGSVGHFDWMLRLRCRPDGIAAMTEALARRPDTAWVSIASGGSEVVCSVRPPLTAGAEQDRPDAAEGAALLLDRLPRSAAVSSMQAVLLLRKFESAHGDWTAFSPGLPDGAVELLVRGRGRRLTDPAPVPREEVLRPDDAALLDLLAADGRATHRSLALATGWSESRVARRLGELFGAGVIDVDVDVDAAALGYRTSAYLWVTVPPPAVEATGWALAALPQVAFVAAVTGVAPLLASVVCRSPDELYRLTTGEVGGLPGVSAVEVAPLSWRVKAAATVVDRGRLVARGPR